MALKIQHQYFILKHIYVSEYHNIREYYLYLYNKLPKIITCFLSIPNVKYFKLISKTKNEYIGISIVPFPLKIYITSTNIWIDAFLHVKVIFSNISGKLLPVHLIDIMY
jgi:hypothetical protein